MKETSRIRNWSRRAISTLAVLATVFALSAPLQGGIEFGPIIGGFVGKGPLGATLGHSVRLTVFNPGNESYPLRLTLFDLNGTLLARRDVNLAPRKGTFVQVDADTLSLASGQRVEIMGMLRSQSETRRRIFVSLQVIDNLTRQTTVAEG